MKKLALMLVVLMALGGAVFAEVTAEIGDVTVSGSVETTVGYDLQNEIWGMDGASDINVQVPFITGDAGAAAGDELYGEITLSGVGLKWDETDQWVDGDYDGTDFATDISAKIVMGSLFVGLNAAGFNANNAVGTAALDINADDDWLSLGGDGSLVLGYDDGSISFGLELAPKGGITRGSAATAEGPFLTWATGYTASEDAVGADQNTTGQIVIGADVSIAAGPLTLPINFVMDSEYVTDTQLIVLGAAPAIASGDITVDLPLDFIMMGDNSGFDIAPSLSYALNADGSSLGVTAYYYSLTVSDVTGDYAQAGLTVTEPLSGGFADGIGADLAVDLTGLTSDVLGWDVSLGLDVLLAEDVTLYLDPAYGSDELFDFGAGLILGAGATGIDNTTITLDYGSACFSDIDASSDNGIVKATVAIAF